MPIQITGLFTPSGGAGSFDLYDPSDIQAGNVNVLLQAIAGGAFAGGSHATSPAGEVIVQRKTTSGIPTHTATEGTLCWVTTDDILYCNNNGSTGWTAVGTSSSGSASGIGSAMFMQDGEDGFQGPPGPQGAAGTTGPQGATGQPGLDGEDGQDGLLGATGPAGARGQMGPPGLDGSDGDDGLQGPTGATGITGAAGPTGPLGPSGLDGEEGPDGVPGIQGPTGATGAIGPLGSPGPQGLDGDDGDIGPRGPTGLTGSQGFQGPPGQDGEDLYSDLSLQGIPTSVLTVAQGGTGSAHGAWFKHSLAGGI